MVNSIATHRTHCVNKPFLMMIKNVSIIIDLQHQHAYLTSQTSTAQKQTPPVKCSHPGNKRKNSK